MALFECPATNNAATSVCRFVSPLKRSGAAGALCTVTNGAPMAALASRSIFNAVPGLAKGAKASITFSGTGRCGSSCSALIDADSAARVSRSTVTTKDLS